MFHLVLLSTTLGSVLALPRQNDQNYEDSHNPKPILLLAEVSNLRQQEQQQEQEILVEQNRQLQFGSPSALTFGGVPYYEQQFRYPSYNQQGFPRVQPSIVLYGAAGQGQPILINPGIPPGHNFLVPQPPRHDPGVIQGPRTPFFVGGYPNPKPAHIPPIERDAEEVPTNPAKIPPFHSKSSGDRKPEKLETFNEDGNEQPFRTINGVDFQVPADSTPQLLPGQRFFFLNGDNLFQDYPYTYPEDLQYTRQQLAYGPQFQAHQPADINSLPLQTLLFRSAANLSPEQNFIPDLYNGEVANFPVIGNGEESVGHFRFTAPGEPHYTNDDGGIEDDAVVVDAKSQDDKEQGVTKPDIQSTSVPKAESDEKIAEPSTAQAAPGAIALAGEGGVAGASPKATSLAGKGGLAISSPQATAVAGADEERVKSHRNRLSNRKPIASAVDEKKKDNNNKASTRRFRNK